MRISDWSSDVCSSDLIAPWGVMRASEHATAWGGHMNNPLRAAILNTILMMGAGAAAALPAAAAEQAAAQTYDIHAGEIDAELQPRERRSGPQLLYAMGRDTRRERGCIDGSVLGYDVS